MKLAVIGPGSMGLLYGGKLSAVTDTILVGNNLANLKELNTHGVTILRGEQAVTCPVKAVQNGALHEPADVILLFTKAYLTQEALEANRALIGKDTFLLTLQNGKGHEETLLQFTDEQHILIGTTAQGSSRRNAHTIVHSGLGDTVFGALRSELLQEKTFAEKAEAIRDVFERAGFPCFLSDNIAFTVWNKLMINASSSVLSGILQKPQGYVIENPWAWLICKKLIREICDAAAGEGCFFDREEQTERICSHLRKAPEGYTSIYSDLNAGRRTEVDVISGAVVDAAKRQGKEAPVSELMVQLVHAMEPQL